MQMDERSHVSIDIYMCVCVCADVYLFIYIILLIILPRSPIRSQAPIEEQLRKA